MGCSKCLHVETCRDANSEVTQHCNNYDNEMLGKITRVVRLLTNYTTPFIFYKYSTQKLKEFSDRECVVCEAYESKEHFDDVAFTHCSRSAYEIVFPVDYLEWQNDKIIQDMFESLTIHDELLYNTRISRLKERNDKLQVSVTVDKEQFDKLVEMKLVKPEVWNYNFESLYPDRLFSTRNRFEEKFDKDKQ